MRKVKKVSTIQWFPGHMAKAKRQVQEQLKSVDWVVEIRDARIPIASKTPLIDQIIQQKKRLIVLNKADLADPIQNKLWLNHLRNKDTDAIAIDSKNNKEIKKLRHYLLEVTGGERQKWLDKGMKQKTIRLMVLGIPNVGKSTLINQLTHKKTAKVGNRPGVTKGQQWVQIDKDFSLLDTPGILWPKFEDPLVGMNLALTGAIKDTHYYSDDIALYAMQFMMDYYMEEFCQFFNLSEEEAQPPYPELMMSLTSKMGMKDDYERFSDWLIREFRSGKIAPMTLDRYEDYRLDQTEEGSADD